MVLSVGQEHFHSSSILCAASHPCSQEMVYQEVRPCPDGGNEPPLGRGKNSSSSQITRKQEQEPLTCHSAQGEKVARRGVPGELAWEVVLVPRRCLKKRRKRIWRRVLRKPTPSRIPTGPGGGEEARSGEDGCIHSPASLQVPGLSHHLGTRSGRRVRAVLAPDALLRSGTLLCPWVSHRRYLIVSAEKFTWGGGIILCPKRAGLNIQSMQISLSLFPSLCRVLSLSEVWFFFCFGLPGKPDTVQTPLRTRECFHAPPLSAPHTVFGSVLPKPHAGKKPPSPPHPSLRLGTLLLPLPAAPRRAGSATLRAPPLQHPSFHSLLLRLPCSPRPPKALFGFSFLKCGLNIIFGKLTALPPTSTNILEERVSWRSHGNLRRQGLPLCRLQTLQEMASTCRLFKKYPPVVPLGKTKAGEFPPGQRAGVCHGCSTLSLSCTLPRPRVASVPAGGEHLPSCPPAHSPPQAWGLGGLRPGVNQESFSPSLSVLPAWKGRAFHTPADGACPQRDRTPEVRRSRSRRRPKTTPQGFRRKFTGIERNRP